MKEVVRYRYRDRAGNLCPSGAVEICHGVVSMKALKGREVGTDIFNGGQSHDGAGSPVVAVFEKLGHSEDARSKKVGEESKADHDQGYGGHPFIAGNSQTDVAGGVAGHPHELEIFNLHLGLSARERASQIGRLVHSGEFSGLDPHRACLVGGDFNDWRSRLHPIFTEILDFRCATQRRSRSNGLTRTFPSFSPTTGLDRVYYRGPVRLLRSRACRLSASRVASDHLPLIADFELH